MFYCPVRLFTTLPRQAVTRQLPRVAAVLPSPGQRVWQRRWLRRVPFTQRRQAAQAVGASGGSLCKAALRAHSGAFHPSVMVDSNIGKSDPVKASKDQTAKDLVHTSH